MLKLTVDTINAEALAGDSGNFGVKGTNGSSGNDGDKGAQGAQAEAYGVYADNGAVITLSAKTDSGTPSGTITIGAKADNATRTEAYAVYADNATVLFNDNAVLNTSDGSSTDNTVITYLNNATLGFGSPAAGQNVGRTINGGTLRLAGSNTFKVAADLSNVTPNADKFTFAKLAADSSTATQYITVGYDKAFDGSSLNSFIGEVTVLTVTDLEHGQNLNNFVGKESVMDDPLTRFLATPTVTVDGNDVKITQIDFEEAGASETVMTAADAQMALGSMWRIEGNNLMKRMGELRSDKEAAKGGVWARYYRGELSLGHIGSVDYTTSNEVSVKQDSVNSAVVRLGFLGGKEFTIGGRTSNAYVKASALHDFGGNGGGTAYYKGRSSIVESADMNGTWYEIGLGANLGIAKNSNLYFDALKTFGGDLRTDWQFNAGLRFTF